MRIEPYWSNLFNPFLEFLSILGISLILTLIIEVVFIYFAITHHRKDLFLVCLVNIMTNPLAVAICNLFPRYSDLNRVFIVLILEITVILVEGKIYKKFGQNFAHPYLISFSANLLSYGAGWFLSSLF